MNFYRNFISVTLVVAMGVMMMACENPNNNEPTKEEKTPTVSVTAGEVGEDWISFTVTSTEATKVCYVTIAEEAIEHMTITAESVLDSTDTVEPNTTQTVTVTSCRPSTTYYVYVAAINQSKSVLSEAVGISTTAHQPSTVTLPSPVYCNINFSQHSSADCYAFAIADEAGALYMSFNLYAADGNDGAIPVATYALGEANAGMIDLGSLILEANGNSYKVLEGTLAVEQYNDGKAIRLDGEFKADNGDTLLLDYDGEASMMGIGSGVVAGNIEVTFTKINNLAIFTEEPGNFEVQFSPAEGFSMLDLMFYSDPAKSHIASGLYPVFDSRKSAEAAGMGNSWIFAQIGPVGSLYQDEMMLPYSILAGMDSYVQINTEMDLNGRDYYDITFSLKIQSVVDGSERLLKGTYKGALGFTEPEKNPSLEMVAFYVDITTTGNTHSLVFHGGFTSMSFTIEGALPEVDGDYITYDIKEGGTFTDMYASIYDASLLSGSRIAIKRFADLADASDEGKVKPYYGFRVEAAIQGYDIVGEWTSFEHDIE